MRRRKKWFVCVKVRYFFLGNHCFDHFFFLDNHCKGTAFFAFVVVDWMLFLSYLIIYRFNCGLHVFWDNKRFIYAYLISITIYMVLDGFEHGYTWLVINLWLLFLFFFCCIYVL